MRGTQRSGKKKNYNFPTVTRRNLRPRFHIQSRMKPTMKPHQHSQADLSDARGMSMYQDRASLLGRRQFLGYREEVF